MELVSVDIGGTHARFAIATVADDGTISLSEPETLHTEDHASFQTAWEDFRGRMGGSLPPRVSMAIAGPVGGDVIRFTNNPWIIRPALVREKLGVEEYCIVNDFEAVAHAVARVDEDQFIHLTGPDKPLAPTGRLSVLGPGTGLGVAHLYREADGTYRVSATEGGHIDFAPLDQIDDAILARLRKRHVRVSVERVVAGPAISDIYQALASMEGRPVAEEDDIAIWKRGQDGSDSLALLGAVALNGVVIAGGLGYRIRDTLLKSGFSERFKSKGRFQELMASIPVKLIVHPQPGLFGAAAAFVREHP